MQHQNDSYLYDLYQAMTCPDGTPLYTVATNRQIRTGNQQETVPAQVENYDTYFCSRSAVSD